MDGNLVDCFLVHDCLCYLSIDMIKCLQKKEERTTLEKEDAFEYMTS